MLTYPYYLRQSTHQHGIQRNLSNARTSWFHLHSAHMQKWYPLLKVIWENHSTPRAYIKEKVFKLSIVQCLHTIALKPCKCVALVSQTHFVWENCTKEAFVHSVPSPITCHPIVVSVPSLSVQPPPGERNPPRSAWMDLQSGWTQNTVHLTHLIYIHWLFRVLCL